MTTVAQVISRSMRLLGQIESGAAPSTDEYADGLIAINALLDSWRNERLLCFSWQDLTLTVSSGDGSYTIGTSGDINTTRPVAIRSVYVVDSNISYPLTALNEDEYAAIPDKAATGDWPTHYLFRPTVTSSLATLIVYPVPNATATLKVVAQIPVTAFSATSDTVTLPPGWEQALAANLAITMAPEFETVPSPVVMKMAQESLAGIKRVNIQSQPRRTYTGIGALFHGNVANIETDA